MLAGIRYSITLHTPKFKSNIMRQSIKDMRKKMKSSPGVNVHLEIPRDLYHRIQALAIADESRSNTKVYKREKVLECLLAGIETLETLDRKS